MSYCIPLCTIPKDRPKMDESSMIRSVEEGPPILDIQQDSDQKTLWNQLRGKHSSSEEGESTGVEESGERFYERRSFSAFVRIILKILRILYAAYVTTRTFLETTISENPRYSIFFFVLLTLLMLFPLIDLLWYLIIRATIALVITLTVRWIHTYCGRKIRRSDI